MRAAPATRSARPRDRRPPASRSPRASAASAVMWSLAFSCLLRLTAAPAVRVRRVVLAVRQPPLCSPGPAEHGDEPGHDRQVACLADLVPGAGVPALLP